MLPTFQTEELSRRHLCTWTVSILFLWCSQLVHSWLPDVGARLTHDLGHTASIKFNGQNISRPDHFVILAQDASSVLLGGRNCVYNLSVYDFAERDESRVDWTSSEAHSQLCLLKGRSEDDCQNYIRVYVRTAEDKVQICGTNSYKPMCRIYAPQQGTRYMIMERETDGIGVCPYDPKHNSTAVYANDQLFSATVADFSGGDPLIYREPQRTELSDLKQLNAPNFVSSIPYDDYVFFFYRETAVEFMNCGKVIYSRVARVCKNDKGGPHQFRHRWTSFLKTRLNCSVPGEYPFYFDEIQSTSDVVKGRYSSNISTDIIYGTLTTPTNAIGGSAICAYRMQDILAAFEGAFKEQEGINSNWLPVSKEKVPEPRPGSCVRDSRILPENNVNFVKTHSLMETAVPAMFGQPILIRVSLQYRFTAIAVDPQVAALDENNYDVLYVGTDDGRVLKVVNIPNGVFNSSARGVVISESIILPSGAAVKQVSVAPGHGKVIVVGKSEVRLTTLNHCHTLYKCSDCVALQDPHCAWDPNSGKCVSVVKARRKTDLIQNILRGVDTKCGSPTDIRISTKIITAHILDSDLSPDSPLLINNHLDALPALHSAHNDPTNANNVPVTVVHQEEGPVVDDDCANRIDSVDCVAVPRQLVIYSADTLKLFVIICSFVTLLVGFTAGFFISRRMASNSHGAVGHGSLAGSVHGPIGVPVYPAAFIEQHNQLDRPGSGNQSNLMQHIRANKVVNVTQNSSPPPKKDNLDASKDLNIASDGTLQKIKKTYI